MGCASSTANGGGEVELRDDVGDLASQELERQLESQQAEEDKIVKLLVLGTGESGKSTVFKQMKILYSVPDPPAKFTPICRANLFGNAHAVVEGMNMLNIQWGSEEGKAAADTIKAAPQDGNVENIGSFVPLFETMFKDAGVQESIERAAEYQLNDSTIYFWNRAEELCSDGYQPNEQDILRARVRTTGIVQQHFDIKGKPYTMFDVGGQRNERRKWIHCFDNVTAVIFVTAISEYDQRLFEDETTNRMDEAVTLFDQICNHESFKTTSMILFLNKRDLFQMKLQKKTMACWEEAAGECGHDYDKAIAYIKKRFLDQNKDPLVRQVYVHATCATDTSNISFVMDSVFDIILKDNLRKLQQPDIAKLTAFEVGSGVSSITSTDVWKFDKRGSIILASAFYTDDLSERKVLVNEDNLGTTPAVLIQRGIALSEEDFSWILALGKDVPVLQTLDKERGTFRGNFKDACAELRKMLGTEELGSIYDAPIMQVDANGFQSIILPCVRLLKKSGGQLMPGKWVVHEEFENEHYKKFANIDTDASPFKAPDSSAEFNPFAANPVGKRWFKGVTLFTKEVTKLPDKGVYLGVFKVYSSTSGFMIMVNEHNRITIPMIFLTENQLSEEEKIWMHGVRIREQYGIDLLEGKQPNRGWLGPEMSGEEGANFPEKLWWAIDEACARLDTDKIGFQYDSELLFIDENNSIQLLMYGVLAAEESDVLPGHIWVNQALFQTQNMKFLCPDVLQAMLNELNAKIVEYQTVSIKDTPDVEAVRAKKKAKDTLSEEIKKLVIRQTPLKWVNRCINWCADGMPSFGKQVPDQDALGTDNASRAVEVISRALALNAQVDANSKLRDNLLANYKK